MSRPAPSGATLLERRAGRRPGSRRSIAIIGWTLIWSGVLVFGYLGWLLYGTDVVNAQVQEQAVATLERRFAERPVDSVPVEEVPAEEGEPVRHYIEEAPAEDVELAHLRVPALDLDAVVFEGVSAETLAKGPGHIPGTALPGQPGNAVISGHRTTYGRPFHDLDLLEPGDRIEVVTAIGTHVYEVRESFVVAPTEVWVTHDRDGAWLTFTTCHPEFSARERLIIAAELVAGPNLEYVRSLQEGDQAPA